jgi:hypothetical protein
MTNGPPRVLPGGWTLRPAEQRDRIAGPFPIIVDERCPRISKPADESHCVLHEYDEQCRAVVDRAGRAISMTGAQAAPGRWNDIVDGQLVPRIRAECGRLVLHGATIHAGDGAIVVIGPTGRGKSTLAAALRQSGFRVYGDDSVEIFGIAGRLHAQAIRRGVRLREDSLNALGPPGKRSSQADPGPKSPLRAVAVLHGAEADQAPSIAHLAAGEGMIAVLSQRFALDPSDPAVLARHFQAASELAQTVPCFDFLVPRDYAALDAVCALFRETFDDRLAASPGRSVQAGGAAR